jgi:hypothetical protein
MYPFSGLLQLIHGRGSEIIHGEEGQWLHHALLVRPGFVVDPKSWRRATQKKDIFWDVLSGKLT